MTTAFTQPVIEDNCSFEDFLKKCLLASGYFYHLRDEQDSDLYFKLRSPYRKKPQKKEASQEEVDLMIEEGKKKLDQDRKKHIENRRKILNMLDEVKRKFPDDSCLDSIKNFMISQLESELEWRKEPNPDYYIKNLSVEELQKEYDSIYNQDLLNYEQEIRKIANINKEIYNAQGFIKRTFGVDIPIYP